MMAASCRVADLVEERVGGGAAQQSFVGSAACCVGEPFRHDGPDRVSDGAFDGGRRDAVVFGEVCGVGIGADEADVGGQVSPDAT